MISISEQSEVMLGADERRNRRWIDPQFQKRYAILLLSIVFLVGSVLIGTFWFHSEQVLKTLTSAGLTPNYSLHQLVSKQMSHLLMSVCVVVTLFAGFVFFMATLLSHRIVGPIFAVKRSLECMANGNYEEARMKLRADDEFHDVAELVNRTVDQLSKSKNRSNQK